MKQKLALSVVTNGSDCAKWERIAAIAGLSFPSPEIFAFAIFDAISGSPDMRKMPQNRAIDP